VRRAIGSGTMQDWMVPVVAGVLAVAALGLAVALLRTRSRTERAVSAARAETAALRLEVEALERRLERATPREPAPEFVITHLGEDEATGAPPARIESALFADLVLRETVVKAASLAHGVRRALDPETRNRIRFEMRRELKRARKQRRVDTRQARREWEARQRARVDEDPAA
jgi:hypothetical protein